jgi:hypothetical protein
MPDDAQAQGPNGQQPAAVVLTITYTPDGNVNVNGPIANKVLCYGMLELAKDAIRRYNPNRVVQPSLVMPPEFMTRG